MDLRVYGCPHSCVQYHIIHFVELLVAMRPQNYTMNVSDHPIDMTPCGAEGCWQTDSNYDNSKLLQEIDTYKHVVEGATYCKGWGMAAHLGI